MSADDTLTLSATPRTALHRHKERGRTDRADLYAVLDAGLICHLGVVIDGLPVVLPTAYGRDGDMLYLHGSSANRSNLAADGQEVCVTVTHLDGIVCARAVFSRARISCQGEPGSSRSRSASSGSSRRGTTRCSSRCRRWSARWRRATAP